jgi:hypothetical protein
MTNQAPPTPINTSPIENTLASGIGLGSTKMSPKNERVVELDAIAEFVYAVVGNTAVP